MEIKNILRTIFVSLLFLPASPGDAVVHSSATFSPGQRHVVLEAIRPSLEATSKLAAQSKPARDTEELQAQIESLLQNASIKVLYQSANTTLDKMATVATLLGPNGIPNFEEVIPGVYRSATPTLSQVESLVANKKIDHVVSLNPELLMLAKMDPGTTPPLTVDRRKAILDSLTARGKNGERAQSLLRLYEDHLTYAQAVHKKSRSYIDAFPLLGPDETTMEYFAALQRIVELREARKNVLFHCNIGKHRTGLMAMLVESLDKKTTPTDNEMNELYLHFIERNLNNEAQTRVHYLIPLPLIIRSEPFKKLALRWRAIGV